MKDQDISPGKSSFGSMMRADKFSSAHSMIKPISMNKNNNSPSPDKDIFDDYLLEDDDDELSSITPSVRSNMRHNS